MTTRTEAATARRDRIAAQLAGARAELKELAEAIEALASEKRLAEAELLAAIAADASDSLPVGTRVRHRTFSDSLATVVESDGTGISVLQDGSALVSNGFGPGEWLPID